MLCFKQKREFTEEAVTYFCLSALSFLQASKKACWLGKPASSCQIYHQDQKEKLGSQTKKTQYWLYQDQESLVMNV